jgi:predicted O-linked N-acetylglucosamine transferase (SPINDLY family)
MQTSQESFKEAFELHSAGQFLAARALYLEILAQNPQHAECHRLLGLLYLQESQDTQSAIHHIGVSLELNPENGLAYLNYGEALLRDGQYELCVRYLEHCLRLIPSIAHARLWRARALMRLGRKSEALQRYEEAFDAGDIDPQAYYDRGMLRFDHGLYSEAVSDFRRLLVDHPEAAPLYVESARSLVEMGSLTEAIACLERALSIDPSYEFLPGLLHSIKMRACQWQSIPVLEARLLRGIDSGQRVAQPMNLYSFLDAPFTHQKAAAVWVESSSGCQNRPVSKDYSLRFSCMNRIKIGYLSPDFQGHAVASLVAELMECHDKQRFEVTCFSFRPRINEAYQNRIALAVDRFIDVSQYSDDQVLQLAEEFSLHVAVDLVGQTKGARERLFAAGLAPIQVNYLGHPGSLGAAYMDYIVADPHLIPENFRDAYTEKIAYLPYCYQPNDSKKTRNDRRNNAMLLDRVEPFVFASFNNSFKITQTVFESWVRILLQCPRSVLWLLESSPCAERNLKLSAQRFGLDPGRLVFCPRVAHPEHQLRHQYVHLGLDTFPYNGHTTTSDALWQGLPVVTLRGLSFAARVASSLLHAAGVPQLITESLLQYEQLAISLFHDRDELLRLHQYLQDNVTTSHLFDTASYTAHLENAYELMVQRALTGQPPQTFSVPCRVSD